MERHPLALGRHLTGVNPIKADGWAFASAVAQAMPGPGYMKRMHTVAWKAMLVSEGILQAAGCVIWPAITASRGR